MLSAVVCHMQMFCYRPTFAFLTVYTSENVCIRQVFGRCSQICVEMPATDTGYMCDCAEGYTLQRNGYICQANGEVWDDTDFTQLSAESFQIAVRLAPLHAQIAPGKYDSVSAVISISMHSSPSCWLLQIM